MFCVHQHTGAKHMTALTLSCTDDLQVRGFGFSANIVRQYVEISIVKKNCYYSFKLDTNHGYTWLVSRVYKSGQSAN